MAPTQQLHQATAQHFPTLVSNKRSDDENSAQNLKEFKVNAGVIGISGFTSDQELLQMMVDSYYCDQLLGSTVVSYLLEFKWKQYGKFLYQKEGIIYSVSE
jgi:hypothetical protein